MSFPSQTEPLVTLAILFVGGCASFPFLSFPFLFLSFLLWFVFLSFLGVSGGRLCGDAGYDGRLGGGGILLWVLLGDVDGCLWRDIVSQLNPRREGTRSFEAREVRMCRWEREQ